MFIRLGFLLAALAAIPLLCSSADGPAKQNQKGERKSSIKLLVLGDSFSEGSVRYLKEISKNAGSCELQMTQAVLPDASMRGHIGLALKHESNPSSPDGSPYVVNGRRMSLKDLLLMDKWDYVSIQQRGDDSFKTDSFRPYAKQLCEYVKLYAPRCEILFLQTWAYRGDDWLYKKSDDDDHLPNNALDMYRNLTISYRAVAAECGAERVVPVGDSFQLVEESPEWGLNSQSVEGVKYIEYPELPKISRSLYVGYAWVPDGRGWWTLTLDARSANDFGCYLGSCVWFEILFYKDVRKVSFKPDSISGADAKFIREIVHKLVSMGGRPKSFPQLPAYAL